MVAILNALVEAIGLLFSWPTIIYLFAGVLVGLLFGATPGLGGVVGLTLAIPVTFGIGIEAALVVFAGIMAGQAFGGAITAILLNIPGTPMNAATLLDGYPLSQQGEGRKAIGAAAMSSASGAIFGILVLFMLIPVVREFILMFGPPEFFWMAVFGLSIIAVGVPGPLIKGLIAGALGLLAAMVGFADWGGQVRFMFGIDFLWDGFQLLPVLIGLFAISEVIYLGMRERIAEVEDGSSGGNPSGGNPTGTVSTTENGSVIDGVRSVIANKSLFFRSSLIGIVMGLVPGVGGSVANFVAYGHAVQTSEDPESFGRGNIQGVIAAEASNDAKDGGQLLPTVAFGIPGGTITAVLLAGFILHGMQVGPTMLTDNLHLLLLLLVSLVIGNLLTSLFGLAFADQLALVTRVKTDYLIPIIAITCIYGSFSLRNHFGDVIVMTAFGFVAIFMMAANYSRVAFILGLILGPLVERNYQLSLQMGGAEEGLVTLVGRPLTWLIIALIVVGLAIPKVKAYRRGDPMWVQSKTIEKVAEEKDLSDAGARMTEKLIQVDRLFLVGLMALMAVFWHETTDFRTEAQLFPQVVIGIVAVLSLYALFLQFSGRGVNILQPDQSSIVDIVERGQQDLFSKGILTALWIVAAIALCAVFGLFIGSTLFVIGFLYIMTSIGALRGTLATAGLMGTVYFVFYEVVKIPGYEGLLGIGIENLLPF